MTIKDALFFSQKKLKNSTSPQLDSEVLLSHALDKTKEYLHANPNEQLPVKKEILFKELITRRTNNEPVAYIRKSKEFFGLNFYVDKNVLIPRPETEGLIELVIEKTKNKNGLKILDLGTGSGCIVISLAKNFPNGKFFASDISKTALAVAKKNAKTHNVKVAFKQGDLLKPWKKQKFDIIVANLPYLELETDPSTKLEPKVALVAANKGLKLYEQLFKQISSHTPLPSSLLLEIGHNQGPQIKKLAAKILPAYETKISKDLSGRVRYAVLSLT